jgi:hypothetical protein
MKTFEIKNKALIFSFIILLLATGCKKETECDVLKGQLIGYVNLIDNQGYWLTDNSGVEVIVEGNELQKKALTNAEGQFIIDNLKSGTYNIIFNKEGYCQHKVISVPFVGGNKPATIYGTNLFALSNLQIEWLAVMGRQPLYPTNLLVIAYVSDQDISTLCRYYLSNGPDISYKNYSSTGVTSGYWSHGDVNFGIPVDTLKFPVGSELYLIMYPASEKYQYYFDINSGKAIYTSININKPSEVVSIAVPE